MATETHGESGGYFFVCAIQQRLIGSPRNTIKLFLRSFCIACPRIRTHWALRGQGEFQAAAASKLHSEIQPQSDSLCMCFERLGGRGLTFGSHTVNKRIPIE